MADVACPSHLVVEKLQPVFGMCVSYMIPPETIFWEVAKRVITVFRNADIGLEIFVNVASIAVRVIKAPRHRALLLTSTLTGSGTLLLYMSHSGLGIECKPSQVLPSVPLDSRFPQSMLLSCR